MASYKFVDFGLFENVIRVADNKTIPLDHRNMDFQKLLEDAKAGSVVLDKNNNQISYAALCTMTGAEAASETPPVTIGGELVEQS